MNRIIVLTFCFSLLFVPGLQAQQTLSETHPDALLHRGKELFVQGKHTASFRILEDFLALASLTQEGQKLEAAYYLAANAFYMGSDDAEMRLKRHLTQYPYTQYSNQVQLMLGILAYNNKRYKDAIDHFREVNDKHLDKRQQIDFMFYEGCTFLEEKEYQRALPIFRSLKNKNTRYNVSASYYYAYTEYALKNYDEALTEFLKIEQNPQYKSIVPYYVVQIYYAQMNFVELKPRAEALLRENPNSRNNAEVYRIMGEIAYREKNYHQAIEYLRKYESIYPQTLRNDLYLLGMSYYYVKDYKNATRYLSKVTIEKDEVSENAYLHLGNAYVKAGDKANARMAYEAALQTNFNRSVREEALFNYALTTLESTSAFGESVKAFEQYLYEFPASKHSDEAYDYLSSVYLTTKNYRAAYESVLRIKNPNAKMLETKQYLLYQLGTESFAQHNWAQAIDYFSLALQADPSGSYAPECHYWRSECFYRLGRPAQSAQDLRAFFADKRSRSSLNYAAANYAAGYAYFAQKNYNEALRFFQSYIAVEKNRRNTTYPDALARIGDCYFITRSFARSDDYYSRAIQAAPNASDYPMFQSAYIDGLQKKYSEKIKKMERLIRNYPKSEYADNALYEIGRSYLMLENNKSAIASYRQLLSRYPNSDLARKAALETGMIYYNMGDSDKAADAYKQVISSYKGSEEAYMALESMEALYIEKNDVDTYLSYVNTLGSKLGKRSVNHADSISYLAAEKQYMKASYAEAAEGMRAYLSKYCPGGRNCTTARYYLSDSYYRNNEKEKALASFKELLALGSNQYTEEAVMRCAEITFDEKDYQTSLGYFKQLTDLAGTTQNRNIGRLGVLRCSYFTDDYTTTINIVNEIMDDPQASQQVKSEARYNRAKAYLALDHKEKASADLNVLSQDTRTESGAEAKYLRAKLYFEQGQLKEAEDEIVDFTKKNTPHQFWLARSLVLLADLNLKQGDDFQAKQYLLSLQRNYKADDEIQTLIAERLSLINEREKAKIAE